MKRSPEEIAAQVNALKKLRETVPATRITGEDTPITVNTHAEIDAMVFTLETGLDESAALLAFRGHPDYTVAAAETASTWTYDTRPERRSPVDWLKSCLPLLALCFLMSGCTSTEFTSTNGDHFKRVSFGSKTSIGKLTLSGDTNGVRTVSLEGYQSDQVQMAGAIAEGVAAGFSKTVKP